MRRLALSDIHGCRATLEALLDRLAVGTSDELYFLGDYIDRGPDSKGVIDCIRQMQDDGYRAHCLMGNHEQLLLNAPSGPQWLRGWLQNGGHATLASFGVKEPDQIPEPYIRFLDGLPMCLEVDEYILVHAGLNFGAENPLADPFGFLWIRDWYPDIDYDWLGDRIILHGHTPIPLLRIEVLFQTLEVNRVLNIDAGCVFPRLIPGLGHLCAFDMTNRKLVFQKNIEKISV